MYNNRVIIRKREVIPPITDHMITDYFCQNQSSVINFTTDDVISKFELFSKNMMNNIYITESMRKY